MILWKSLNLVLIFFTLLIVLVMTLDLCCSYLYFHQYGGFSKFPGDLPDLYHSYYGFTAFSLLEEPGLNSLCAELGMTDLAAIGI